MADGKKPARKAAAKKKAAPEADKE